MAPINPKAEEVEKELEQLYKKASEGAADLLTNQGLGDDRTPDMDIDPTTLAPESEVADSTTESTVTEGDTPPETPSETEETQSEATTDSQDKVVVPPEAVELKRWQKRYRDVQSWADRTNAENAMLKKRMEELEAQTRQFAEKLKNAPEAITETQKEILEEFPELGEKLPKLLNELVGPQITSVKNEVNALRQEKALLDQQMLRNQIVSRVPDFDEIRNSQYFNQWLQSDGENQNDLSRVQKQAILESNSPLDAVRLFTQFKEEFNRNVISKIKVPPQEEQAPPKPNPQQAAEATAEPRSDGRNPFVMPVSQPSMAELEKLGQMSNDEYEKHRDRIYQQAQQALKDVALV